MVATFLKKVRIFASKTKQYEEADGYPPYEAIFSIQITIS